MNKTLFKYIFKMQLKAMVFVSIAIFCLILLFDFAEITRKYPVSNWQETIFSIKLSLLRTPSTFGEILHYVYFITATFSLWSLCQSHQITILKSSGRSPQQILYPFLGFATFISVIWLFVIHPIGLLSEAQYNKNVSPNISSEINHDVWIDYSKSDLVIFIKTIHGPNMEGVYIFDTGNGVKTFAQNATIKKTIWVLKNVTIIDNDQIKNVDTMEISNNISTDLVTLFSKSPEKHDIYRLYKIYKIQKKDKVLLRAYELELHKLLSNCYSFLLFALIAAVICFPINRYKTKTNITIKIIFTAIFLRFANDIFRSLAHREVIPVQLACWAVMSILTCIFIAILIWREA